MIEALLAFRVGVRTRYNERNALVKWQQDKRVAGHTKPAEPAQWALAKHSAEADGPSVRGVARPSPKTGKISPFLLSIQHRACLIAPQGRIDISGHRLN
jgi:hypothetical protein